MVKSMKSSHVKMCSEKELYLVFGSYGLTRFGGPHCLSCPPSQDSSGKLSLTGILVVTGILGWRASQVFFALTLP